MTEKEGIKEELKSGKLRRGLGNIFGKIVYTLKDEWKIHKQIAKHGIFVGGAATGAALGLAGKGWNKFKEHVWSKNQFDKLIWLGLFYYALQWYYKLMVGKDVFSSIPYEFTILNFVMALVVLIFFFKPGFIEFLGTGVIITLYLFIINTGFKFNLPLVGELGLLFTLIIVTVIMIIILREIFHIDPLGVILVSLTFLLEIGFKIFIANIVPVSFLTSLILYIPYWILLALIAGGYVEEGSSKLVGFFRGVFGIILILFLVSNLLLAGTTYGAEKFSISEEKKEAGSEALKESISNIGTTWKRLTAPLACIGSGTDWDECIAEKTAVPKKEMTEEEKLLAVANKKNPPKIDLFFNNPFQQYFYPEENEDYENIRISTQLRGSSAVDKEIYLKCSVNEIEGIITYPEEKKTVIEEQNSDWYQDIECQPTEKLKSGINNVEILAKWRQTAGTTYINYFMESDKLNNILSEYKTADYSENEKQCHFSQDEETCLRSLRKRFYPQIEDFKKIETDYPNFEKASKYEDEAAAIIIEVTDPQLVIGVPEEGEKFNLRFSVANNREGEISKIWSIKIYIPDLIGLSGCDILEKNSEVDENEYNYKIKAEKINLIDWSKTKVGKQKIIPGICELKINKIEDFKRTEIKGKIDFDYQLKNKFNVIMYSVSYT